MRRGQSLFTIFRVSAVTACLLASSSSFASAFQIWEQTAYGTGDYHAGAAAEGSDASLEFYNPAQITDLKHAQVSAGGVLIPVNIKFNGTVNSFPGNGKSDLTNVVPNFHYATPLSKRWYFAFGLTTPFGLQTNYGTENAVVAAAATKTQLLTMNANPNLAVKIEPWISLAAGIDFMYGLAAYDSAPAPETPFKNNLDGWGVGYNAGIYLKFRVFNLPYQTHIGASYRSQITVKASGKSRFQGFDTHVKAKFGLPPTTTFSIFQRVNQRLALMGSVFYTQWDVFTLLNLENTAVNNGSDIPVYELYNDSWNVALGAHVKLSRTFTWKVGGGWDQTPTREGYRDIRLPDANRFALSTGFHWQPAETLGVDVGYTHLFAPQAHVDNSASAQSGGFVIPSQIGTARLDANVFGGQLTWTII